MVYLVNQMPPVTVGEEFIFNPFVYAGMAREATETIRVTPENWEQLNSLKEPGDTFNDVVSKLLEEAEKGNRTMLTTAD